MTTQDGTEKLPAPRTSNDQALRLALIEQSAKNADVSRLSRLAEEEGGFHDDQRRRLAWPVLLGLSGDESMPTQPPATTETRARNPKKRMFEGPSPTSRLGKAQGLPAHPDEQQVRLDVDRSFVGLLDGVEAILKHRRREQLNEIICAVLRLHPQLHYFQGFHDIVSVCLLVLDDLEATLACVESLSLFRIRDSMGTTIEPVMGYLRLLKRILRAHDPAFASVVEQAANLPYFSLSWVLTLLSHDLPDLPSSARLFDFLLAHNPAMMAYLAAALVLEKREAVAELQQDPDFAEDPAMLHTTLSKLPPLSASASPVVAQNSTDPPVGEKEDPAYWPDPDVLTPAFQKVEAVVRAPTLLSIDEIVTRTLELWRAYPLESPLVRTKELFGHNSCIYTFDQDISVEEAQKIVQEGVDVVLPEPLPIAVLPVRRMVGLLNARSILFAAVGVAGLGVAFAAVMGRERQAQRALELVWWSVRKLAGR